MIEIYEIEKKLLDEIFIQKASDACCYNYNELKSYIITSLEEARYTLKLVNRYDLMGKNILEFGSGLGIASIALYMKGYNITSFEPGGLGFEKNIEVSKFIKNYLGLDFSLIDDLGDIPNDSFDLIFSNNVLEHVEDYRETLARLNCSLVSNGKMLHNIPNYIIPYEPHFGILFCPIYPKKMSFLLKKNITDTDVWKSLNFINYFTIKMFARKTNASVVFDKAVTYSIVLRLQNDKEFKSRHSRLSKVIELIFKLRLVGLLKFIPKFLNTPMIFEWSKND